MQRLCERDPASPAAVLFRFELPKHLSKHALRSQMLALLIAQQPCIVSTSPLPVFLPSHLPPFPNLYVNALFLKQYYMHIYPLKAEAKKPTINSRNTSTESSLFVITVIPSTALTMAL